VLSGLSFFTTKIGMPDLVEAPSRIEPFSIEESPGVLLDLVERSARDLLAGLVADGILGSQTPKGPVSLRFPLDVVEILFPRLFAET
jgi:hypothetical protein